MVVNDCQATMGNDSCMHDKLEDLNGQSDHWIICSWVHRAYCASRCRGGILPAHLIWNPRLDDIPRQDFHELHSLPYILPVFLVNRLLGISLHFGARSVPPFYMRHDDGQARCPASHRAHRQRATSWCLLGTEPAEGAWGSASRWAGRPERRHRQAAR